MAEKRGSRLSGPLRLRILLGFTTDDIQWGPGPSLEKLLIDIRRDKDFDYLAGEECSRMLENAFNMFTVNTTKLLRYAGRRGVRTEIENEIKGLNHDKYDSKTQCAPERE